MHAGAILYDNVKQGSLQALRAKAITKKIGLNGLTKLAAAHMT